MARTMKWRNQIYEIAARVRNSRTETWTRTDLERVFDLKRASVQTLMKAIGGVEDLGGKHVVSRDSLLSYLDALIKADDAGQEHRTRVAEAQPVPRPRTLERAVPEDLRSIMVRDLPPEITIEPGRIEIRGANAEAILESLVVLGMALQNDLDTAARILASPRPQPDPMDDELRRMFAGLREKKP